MQSTHRFYHTYSDQLYPIKIDQPGVPNVYRQAEALGGKFTRILHGLPENSVANFSPSILRHNGKTFIAWRSQPEPFGFRHDMKYFYLNAAPTDIYIGELADDSTIVGTKKLRNKKHRLSYEDPRLFTGPDDELYVQFVGSTYASKYDQFKNKLFAQPKVVVCYVNENGDAVSAAIPPIGKNKIKEEPEKNWCFFSHDNELCCLYSTRPLIIEREQGKRTEVNTDVLDQVTHKHPTFNSTPPISLKYGYLVFYHWKHLTFKPDGTHYLQYHLSAYIVDHKLSKITHIIKKPLFSGSLNDRLITWTDYTGNPVSSQPAVILPFGAYINQSELVMSLGVNDAFMGVFRCPLQNILELAENAED